MRLISTYIIIIIIIIIIVITIIIIIIIIIIINRIVVVWPDDVSSIRPMKYNILQHGQNPYQRCYFSYS